MTNDRLLLALAILKIPLIILLYTNNINTIAIITSGVLTGAYAVYGVMSILYTINFRECFTNLISGKHQLQTYMVYILMLTIVGDLVTALYLSNMYIWLPMYTLGICTLIFLFKYVYTNHVINQYTVTSYFDMILDKWKEGDYMFVANTLDQLDISQSSQFIEKVVTDRDLKDIDILLKLINTSNK